MADPAPGFELTEEQHGIATGVGRILAAAMDEPYEKMVAAGLSDVFALTVVVQCALQFAAINAITSARREFREPNREWWMESCGAAFDRQAKSDPVTLKWKLVEIAVTPLRKAAENASVPTA